MLISTHRLMGKNILKNMAESKKNMISNFNFIYGNIKPDIVSKYKLKKHYAKESYSMILNKIINLSKLSTNDIDKDISKTKLSQELGVICHFLCDFFCIAHSEVWREKYKIFTHINYEKKLAKNAKKFNFTDGIFQIQIDDIKSFIENCFNEHEKEYNFNNDISFAYYVCSNTIDYILESIIKNSFSGNYISKII